MFTMPSRRPAGGRRTTALLAALVTLPALVACSAPSEVVPVAAVSARHAAPADLAVTTEGDALVATWAAPPTATSMDLTGYELYVDDAAVVPLDAGTTSHRLAGVRPGDRVYVQVRAVGVDGPGQLAEASTEQVWATPTARSRSAVVEEPQAVAATPTVAPTAAAPVPTPTRTNDFAATPAPFVTVTTAPEPAPTVTREVVQKVEVDSDTDWRAVYDQYQDSVVQVRRYSCSGLFTGHGTAFFVGPSLLATDAHVVDGDARSTVEVDSAEVETTLVGIDRSKDLALLRIDASYPDRVLDLSPTFPAVGTEHAVIGFASIDTEDDPYDLYDEDQQPSTGKSLQVGVISAVGIDYHLGAGRIRTGMVQSDAQTEGGASGAPYITADGLVVGMDDLYAGPRSQVTLGLGMPTVVPTLAAWVASGQELYPTC
ncbi:S1 family peptidase [Pseudokineococcus lusitanus]|uniref:Trypsin-like peptidase n=1 Tax=Pseudokineococcus lusitanus TaxID=763993 RepID=A0A3N1HTM2_9ACTN|nr:serine protease [Pseudokineococcus lusitanus]ROP45865.1 trypsin-like peptidase [Pseudokineococcus lusitanus]